MRRWIRDRSDRLVHQLALLSRDETAYGMNELTRIQHGTMICIAGIGTCPSWWRPVKRMLWMREMRRICVLVTRAVLSAKSEGLDSNATLADVLRAWDAAGKEGTN